jgi:hypothetical protein
VRISASSSPKVVVLHFGANYRRALVKLRSLVATVAGSASDTAGKHARATRKVTLKR